MQISYATEAAPGHVNEDIALCGPDWAVVLDGATAPDGVDSGCIHDVRWLVSKLATGITKRMLRDRGDLQSLLYGAIWEVRQAHGKGCDLANPDSPSSTVSIVRVRGSLLDYLVLADSPIVVRTDGDLKVISDDRLAHLPGGRPYSRDLVRSLRNQPGGFWVASTDPDAAFQAVAGSMPVTADVSVGMFTDGVSRLADDYGYTWTRIFSLLETMGPSGLISIVREVEQGKPPSHGKEHDDATAVLMSGGPVEPASAPTMRPPNWRSLVGM